MSDGPAPSPPRVNLGTRLSPKPGLQMQRDTSPSQGCHGDQA